MTSFDLNKRTGNLGPTSSGPTLSWVLVAVAGALLQVEKHGTGITRHL